jgi:hypothetical protein
MKSFIRLMKPRTALHLALSLAALAGTVAIDAGRQARADGAWCADQGGRGGYTNCGYYSFEQCLDAVNGVGGSCRPNSHPVVFVEPANILIYRPM